MVSTACRTRQPLLFRQCNQVVLCPSKSVCHRCCRQHLKFRQLGCFLQSLIPNCPRITQPYSLKVWHAVYLWAQSTKQSQAGYKCIYHPSCPIVQSNILQELASCFIKWNVPFATHSLSMAGFAPMARALILHASDCCFQAQMPAQSSIALPLHCMDTMRVRCSQLRQDRRAGFGVTTARIK